MGSLKFKGMCSSTNTSGREYLFKVLKSGRTKYDADRIQITMSRKGVSLPKPFTKCMTFIGGFTDSAFFVKSAVEELSPEELTKFTGILKETSEAYKTLYSKR